MDYVILLCCLLVASAQRSSCRQAPSTGLALPTAQRKAQGSIVDPNPDVDMPSNRLIVVLGENAPDAATAAAAIITEVQTAMAATPALRGAAASTAAEVGGEITYVRSLGGSSATDTAGAEIAAAVATSTISSSSGPRSVVLIAPSAAVAHIKRSKLVKTVVADRVIVHQAATDCARSTDLSAGVRATPARSFKWPGCLPAGSKIIWKGKPCRMDRVQYTEMYAVDRKGEVIYNAGKLCMLAADSNRATWNRQRFGACGAAPMYARTLPTSVCTELSAPDLDDTANPITVKPVLTVLPRTPLTPGEQIPAGISRIEAALQPTGAFDTAGLPLSQQVVVGVVDSGIDAKHPDLNVIGGSAWAGETPQHADDSQDPLSDDYGHGTHIAGIIGAKNTGNGVVGVAPGVPLYSLKVLDGEGIGALSDAMAAVEWAAGPEGKAKGIRVVNLSLAAFVDPKGADYAATYDLVCNSMKLASDAGITLVTAIGNYAANMAGYLPASCPSVVAVTSMDPVSNEPSRFTNFVAADSAGVDRTRIFAAPGNAINSTMSYKREPSGYLALSGTSMASPHVAGVFATCMMAGSCAYSATGISRAATIQAAAAERLRIPGAAEFDFTGSLASGSINGKIVGNLVWAKF